MVGEDIGDFSNEMESCETEENAVKVKVTSTDSASENDLEIPYEENQVWMVAIIFQMKMRNR